MNFRIELRYAMLISLLMLLWLSGEFMIGFQDNPQLIPFHPVVSFFSIIIPVVCGWLTVRDKREMLDDKITFGQAFVAGFVTTAFAAMLSIPVQLVFHYFINPDYFITMINFAVEQKKATYDAAQVYFNLKSYIFQSVLGTLVVGSMVALVMAWRMSTPKPQS